MKSGPLAIASMQYSDIMNQKEYGDKSSIEFFRIKFKRENIKNDIKDDTKEEIKEEIKENIEENVKENQQLYICFFKEIFSLVLDIFTKPSLVLHKIKSHDNTCIECKKEKANFDKSYKYYWF